MEPLSLGLIASAFFAGLLMFLAPCTLPIVPAYLGFISGVSVKDLEDPSKAQGARRKILINGIAFVIGFSLVFILFGTFAGLLGTALADFRIWFSRIGGVLVILFGLFMLGAFNLSFLQKERRIRAPKWLSVGHPSTSVTLGTAFAFGWTPCVGPVLASILLLASTQGAALEGALLLSVFSLGLAVPFLAVALAYGQMTRYIERAEGVLKIISYIGGVFLIGLGLLLLFNNFGVLIQYGYQIFDFLEYEQLQQYL